MNYVFLAIRTLIIVVITLIVLRVFTLLVNRVPGLFVSLSVIAIGILSVALYKGSFRAVGLKNRRAILWAIGGSVVVFFVSGIVLLFVD